MTRTVRNGLLAVFALLSAAWVLRDGFAEQSLFWEFWLSVPLLGAAACAVALLCGVIWTKYTLRILVSLLLLFWSISWGAQHAIDRTLGFWMVWALVELLLVGVLYGTREKYDSNAPRA
jgi:hypothetical protein